MKWDAIAVFVFFFLLVTVLGFMAARWRRGERDLNDIHEWGLAGRRFGTIITWFLLGGDLYTAYTFIAVPAAVMSIAAGNLFTRNIYKEYIKTNASEREESQVAKITSLVVKFGALLFIIYVNPQQVIYFQLLGGIWILQTLPAVFLGLYTRWFNRWALLIGWAISMILGTWLFFAGGNSPISTVPLLNTKLYIAITALVLNLVIAAVLTPIFEAIGARRGLDATQPADYIEETAPVEPEEAGREVLG